MLFAYSEGVYSGRRIQKRMEENLAMHWLTGQQIVSYRTINRFRSSETAAYLLQDLYVHFTVQLKLDQLITFDQVFIDGTKFEADANNYSFAWKKAIDRYEAALTHSVTTYFNEQI
ncbi:transposase [Facklamia sp. P12937]|uniref:transposase n=1 Tax=Facklamia sp. P12937 TaxID=3421949 RepID=UPI003D175603